MNNSQKECRFKAPNGYHKCKVCGEVLNREHFTSSSWNSLHTCIKCIKKNRKNAPPGYRTCKQCKKIVKTIGFDKHSCLCSVCKNKRYEEYKDNHWWFHLSDEERIMRKKEKERQEKRIYRRKHRKEIKQRRRARQKCLQANFNSKEWQLCLKHFNNKCAYCGSEMSLCQDHFVPLAKGGEYTRNNIIPACASCNSDKRDLDFFEWYLRQKFYSKRRENRIYKYLNYKNGIQQLMLCI